MFTAGLSISAPKQFTLLAVIFRPALKDPKCTLVLHHHLKMSGSPVSPSRDSTDKRWTSTGVQILLNSCHFCCTYFVTAQVEFLSCFSFLRLASLYSQVSPCLVTGLRRTG